MMGFGFKCLSNLNKSFLKTIITKSKPTPGIFCDSKVLPQPFVHFMDTYSYKTFTEIPISTK